MVNQVSPPPEQGEESQQQLEEEQQLLEESKESISRVEALFLSNLETLLETGYVARKSVEL